MTEEDWESSICDVGRLLFSKNMVAANDGNISVRIADNEVLITPTGVSKGFLSPDMIVKVDLAGKVIAGNHAPSSEMSLHLGIYRASPDVKSVVHAHPPFATAFAVAGIALDRPIMPESLSVIPVATYGTPGTEELAESVRSYVDECSAALLANHGVVTWADGLYAAYYRMERVEFVAKVSYLAKQLGGANELSPEQVKRLFPASGS